MIAGEEQKWEDEVDGEQKPMSVEEREMKATLNASSMVDINKPKTMKIVRSIKEKEMVILLDSKATYNFISK